MRYFTLFLLLSLWNRVCILHLKLVSVQTGLISSALCSYIGQLRSRGTHETCFFINIGFIFCSYFSLEGERFLFFCKGKAYQTLKLPEYSVKSTPSLTPVPHHFSLYRQMLLVILQKCKYFHTYFPLFPTQKPAYYTWLGTFWLCFYLMYFGDLPKVIYAELPHSF